MSEFFRFIGLTLIESYGADANARNCGGRQVVVTVHPAHKAHGFVRHTNYRVTHLVANLVWVELDLGCSTILLGQ